MQKVLYILLFSLCLYSCQKANSDKVNSSNSKKGFDVSTERPDGTPFNLPQGITIINGKFKGYAPGYEQFCNNKTEADAIGSGMGVRLCLGLYNNTTQLVRVTFPAGMIFISQSLDVQNGILIQGETVELPPTTEFYVPLYLYCLNASRNSAFPEDDFELGPVTNDTDMQEFFELIKNKKLPKTGIPVGPLQQVIWHACSGSIDDDDKAYIKTLPNK